MITDAGKWFSIQVVRVPMYVMTVHSQTLAFNVALIRMYMIEGFADKSDTLLKLN